MVPVIDPSRNLSKVLNYNENKVQRGVADFISAGNFLKPTGDLNYYDKFQTLQNLNELNTRTEVPVLHISLNFHPEDGFVQDKDKATPEQLAESQKKLSAIAELYMEKIGFGQQPYLVYQHFDAGHPHIHIVTTIIQADGKRINTRDIGKNESVAARKEIDQLYGLRRVEDSKHALGWEPEPANAKKLEYGKPQTKKAVKDILRYVLKKYKFTSLHELNAILRQYNVIADPGSPDSRINKNGGLVYRVLNEYGEKDGVPIKASDFYFKPTLKNLQEKFRKNKPLRDALLPGIKGRIDWTLGKQPKDFQTWIEELRKEGIQVVQRINKDGLLYGLTYIDFKTHTVLNGSDLVEGYSANDIKKRFSKANKPILSPASRKKARAVPKKPVRRPSRQRPGRIPGRQDGKNPPTASTQQAPSPTTAGPSLLHDLLTAQTSDPIPFELTTDRRKKKKKKQIQQ